MAATRVQVVPESPAWEQGVGGHQQPQEGVRSPGTSLPLWGLLLQGPHGVPGQGALSGGGPSAPPKLPLEPLHGLQYCNRRKNPRTYHMISFGREGLWMAAWVLSCQRLETFYPPLLHWSPHLGRKSSQGHRTPWCPLAQLLDGLSCKGGGNLPSISQAQEREGQCAEWRLEGG